MNPPTVLNFEDYPSHSLSVLLFKDVANSSELRGKLITGVLSPEAAIINANLVPDLFILHAAAYKALVNSTRQSLITKTLHSELVFNLSGTKHIGESLSRFGVSDTSKHLLVARFDASPEDIQQIREQVQGTESDIAELESLKDLDLLKKYYKMTEPELNVGTLTDAVLNKMASRDCL